MKSIKSFLVLLLAISITVPLMVGCGGSSSKYEEPPLDEETKFTYIKEAFTFTFPLVYMHLTKVRFTNAMCPTPIAAPINQFCHSEAIADANYTETAHVNNDIVCSQAFLDLKDDAVVFTKPIPDRFCMFELFDAYTNCVITIGKGTKSNAKKYLITGPNFKDKVPKGMTQIKVPTNIAWLIGRIRCFGEDDLENVKEIQRQIDAKVLKLYLSGGNQPYSPYYDPNEYVPLTKLRSLTSDEYFNLANELMVTNPPKAEDKEILKRMKKVGVGPGLTFKSEILGENGYRYFESMKLQCMNNEWSSNSRQYQFHTSNHDSGLWSFYTYNIGNFGTEYDYRAFCALNYLCAHPNSSCVTYFKYKDDNDYTLNGSSTYRMRFKESRFPPLEESGFWSITLYDSTNHLITENDNKVFTINNLTELEPDEAGYTDIYLTPVASSSTNASLSANILPTPKGKQFHLLMRIYLPNEAAINGFWSAPIITRVEEN